jgi:CheY-like chemotaxis protein
MALGAMGLHDSKMTVYARGVANRRAPASEPAAIDAAARFSVGGDGASGAPALEAAADDLASARELPPASELAAGLHEVSNALTVVLGWIDRAREASAANADPLDVDRALGIAAARARQARVIVRRAIGADVGSEPPRTVADVVADAALGLEPEARDEGVRIEARVAEAAAPIEIADAASVLQILTNLLLNAIDVSPAGAAVRLEAKRRRPDGALLFAVEDEGPGVPPARRATLFSAGVSTRAGGVGIGLRHAAALARAAGGSLALAEGSRGARFELAWPAPEGAPPASGAAPSKRSTSLDGARILLVEDDDAVVELLDTALGARGATIVAVKVEHELASALASGPFDAALLDASPFAGALAAALAAVRRASPSARLVVISGSACAPASLPGGLDVAWVRKPFEISEIVACLTAFGPPSPSGR